MDKLNLNINVKFFDRNDAVKKLRSLSGASKKLSSYLISAKQKDVDKAKLAKQLGISGHQLDQAAHELLNDQIVKKLIRA
ncbi:hypothetical protein WR164_03770 [Philodulcilactobacillus myokoensis]|uniref:Uncharacterized protein n=1 Tax=Philodulcilactobacillus myokoensis TaxID=2929573 RepID=A0A9W6B0I5_9LACO|nr:hypothetical protein [Philodulcilactobacillus myokoensis]GLB46398.1 hypothetical protein WR164_03770 [Philodulcilactobacillus myokoensis]